MLMTEVGTAMARWSNLAAAPDRAALALCFTAAPRVTGSRLAWPKGAL